MLSDTNCESNGSSDRMHASRNFLAVPQTSSHGQRLSLRSAFHMNRRCRTLGTELSESPSPPPPPPPPVYRCHTTTATSTTGQATSKIVTMVAIARRAEYAEPEQSRYGATAKKLSPPYCTAISGRSMQ